MEPVATGEGIAPPDKSMNWLKPAVIIALIIHVSGIIGMLSFNRGWFVALTPVNLIIMSVLLFLTHQQRSKHFYLFFLLCWCTGMITEIIGVHTALLFGNYFYGTVLGPAIAGVPILIGINWFAIVYCSAAVVEKAFQSEAKQEFKKNPAHLFSSYFSVPVLGASLTTFFDWVMEPVAVKLGYWTWALNDGIPLYNYICWFLISMLLLIASRTMKLKINNTFAVYLFFIQLLFFVLLRIFLK